MICHILLNKGNKGTKRRSTIKENNMVSQSQENPSIINTTNYYSALVAPLAPVEKLSIKRTVFFSKGTVVPPEVMITTLLFKFFDLLTKVYSLSTKSADTYC